MPVPDMHFVSLAALWHMEGHGPFVWSAYAIVFVVVASLAMASRARSRTVLQRVRRRIDAQQYQSPEN
jgi:heme exporter protein D